MNREMRKLVEEGYENGEYAKVFRVGAELNPIEQEFFAELLQRLPPNASLLDFGSGVGIPYDKYLVERGHRVTGIDISHKHVASAMRNVPEGTYLKGDFSSLEFKPDSTDAIISLYAIFHIPRDEHAALFRKMHRLLKRNGVILVTLGTSGSEYGEEPDWCGARMAWSTYDPETYKRIISEAGFTVVKAGFEGEAGGEEYHFWLLAAKT
jgi:cyclopropane fatty-acyl-phospholipid synthase-like methyltransferase